MQFDEVVLDNMMLGQLLPGQSLDAQVYSAMSSLRRDEFLDEAHQGIAYIDEDIPLAHSRVMLKPLLHARLLEAAEVQPSDIVLDVGCLSGYSSIILSKMCKQVVGVEEQREFADQARHHIKDMNVKNVEIVSGSLVAGYPSIAPYDTIIINGAIECLNKALIEQLKEGGKIITVKLDSERSASSKLGRVTVIQKMNDTLQEQVLMDAHTQLLPGFDKKVKFSL